MLLAQIIGGYSLVQLIVLVIIVAACAGVMFIALRQFGVTIPPFVIQILWIVVVAVVAIFAIRLLLSM